MFKCVSVLVALVCLSAPAIGRSWGDSQDLSYDVKDDYDHKSWVAEPNDGLHHRPNHGWGHDFGSSEEESWESQDDYQDYHRGLGYGKDKFNHFGYHHNHEGHNYDHHNHGDYGYHHHHWPNHQEHARHNSDNKHDYHGYHSLPESKVRPSFGLPQNNKGNVINNLRPTPAQNPGSKPISALPQNSQNRDQFSRNNANSERVVFPEDNQTTNLSTTRSPPATSSSTLSPTPAVTQLPTTSTTISSLVLQDIVRCIRDCPATPEFNPVCGTNNVTYNNLGALECTRNCGVNVALKRRAPCPQPLPPAYFISVSMQSTEQPIVNAPAVDDKTNAPIARSLSELAAQTTLPPITVKPTRFTNIQNNQDSDLNIDRRVNP